MSARNRPGAKADRRAARVNRQAQRPGPVSLIPRPRNGHQDVRRMLAGMLRDVPLEHVVTWAIMEANPSALADIAARSIALTNSVTDLYRLPDDESLYDISARICAAVAIDAMNADQLGDVSGAETERTLAVINAELSQRVRVGGVA